MNKSPIHLYDAHTHSGPEADLKFRRSRGIVSLVSAGTPPEAAGLDALIRDTNAVRDSVLFPTYGLHPWHSAEYSVSEMAPYYDKCAVIGEIGMDSVWCSVPLEIQEKVFTEQLSIASRLKKPVILHTKGQEERIAAIIGGYPNTYLVHWYSCAKHLEDYLAQDCYFSIGPDVWWNEPVRRTASLVPLDRLLVETDGMGAVKWAFEEAKRPGGNGAAAHTPLPPPANAENALYHSINYIADLRGISSVHMQQMLEENFLRFVENRI